jgi:hypothetical protein
VIERLDAGEIEAAVSGRERPKCTSRLMRFSLKPLIFKTGRWLTGTR